MAEGLFKPSIRTRLRFFATGEFLDEGIVFESDPRKTAERFHFRKVYDDLGRHDSLNDELMLLAVCLLLWYDRQN